MDNSTFFDQLKASMIVTFSIKGLHDYDIFQHPNPVWFYLRHIFVLERDKVVITIESIKERLSQYELSSPKSP